MIRTSAAVYSIACVVGTPNCCFFVVSMAHVRTGTYIPHTRNKRQQFCYSAFQNEHCGCSNPLTQQTLYQIDQLSDSLSKLQELRATTSATTWLLHISYKVAYKMALFSKTEQN